MSEKTGTRSLAPLVLAIVLIWAAAAAYFLYSTVRSVDQTAEVVPGITRSLEEIDRNTAATKEVGELERLNRRVLAASKPLVPILRDLNEDTSKLGEVTQSILETNRAIERAADRTEGLVRSVAAGARSTNATVQRTATSATGVRNAVEATVDPGRSTLRNILETEPSIGSVELQTTAIVGDLGVVFKLVEQAIEDFERRRICKKEPRLPFCKGVK